MATTGATTASPIVSGTTTLPSSSSSSSSSGTTLATNQTIAGNFQTFLTLLTTQLQNQNPLDPLDTNQFTQQLVQFAQVEQQLKSNDQLATLVSLQQTAQATQALNFVGSTAVVDGSTAAMTKGSATWNLNSPKPASAHVIVTNSTGQTVFSADYTVNAGNQAFQWNGKGNDGTQWPDGNYTIAVTATDASGQPATISTQIEGTVDSVDLSKTPPTVSIGGNNYTISQIKQVIRAGAPQSSSSSSN
jgi:flagellar basal-body rod modification protein FlgD